MFVVFILILRPTYRRKANSGNKDKSNKRGDNAWYEAELQRWIIAADNYLIQGISALEEKARGKLFVSSNELTLLLSVFGEIKNRSNAFPDPLDHFSFRLTCNPFLQEIIQTILNNKAAAGDAKDTTQAPP